MGKYGTAGQVTEDNIIGRMRFACWVTEAPGTHSEKVILSAFPQQKWLREGPTLLRYVFIVPRIISETESVN